MVIWTPGARIDLKAIYDYIAQTAPINARQVVTDLRIKADAITDVPFSGKVVPELNDEYLREVHAHAWRVIYHVCDRDMYVIAVIHKRQQITSADIRDLSHPE